MHKAAAPATPKSAAIVGIAIAQIAPVDNPLLDLRLIIVELVPFDEVSMAVVVIEVEIVVPFDTVVAIVVSFDTVVAIAVTVAVSVDVVLLSAVPVATSVDVVPVLCI